MYTHSTVYTWHCIHIALYEMHRGLGERAEEIYVQVMVGWLGVGAQVLDGQMLELWDERAKEVQANGWHWEYQFIDLQVSTVLYCAILMILVYVQ